MLSGVVSFLGSVRVICTSPGMHLHAPWDVQTGAAKGTARVNIQQSVFRLQS